MEMTSFSGEEALKTMLVPTDTPEAFLVEKGRFVALCAAGMASLTIFGRLMWNNVPSPGEMLIAGAAAGLSALALFPLLHRTARRARKQHLGGIAAALMPLLFLLLVL